MTETSKKTAASKTVAKAAEKKAEDTKAAESKSDAKQADKAKDSKGKSGEEPKLHEQKQDEHGVLPVERSGLTSITQDDLNPAYAPPKDEGASSKSSK